jgi:enamine deaminase RidA (YjgF/YER057c/UK114 family)
VVEIVNTGGGGRFEKIGSYVRAKRIGPFVYVAGTTAIEPTGKLHAPNDAYAQTLYALARVERALEEVGASMSDVVATRLYIADMTRAGEIIRAHGEVFAGINPVSTGVGVVLTTPGMMVEVEVEAIIAGNL